MGITTEITRRVRGVAEDERVRRIAGTPIGLVDRASGQIKQIAGTFLGNEGLRRQGREEERKGEVRHELAEQRAREAAERASADEAEREARDRAAEAARREFRKADRTVEAEEVRKEFQARRTETKAEQVAELERATDPAALAESTTKDRLLDEAARLGVEGRAAMTKRQLAEAIIARR